MDPITGPIRWGIAGTGGIATSFAEAFPKLNDNGAEGVMAAVGSRHLDTATTFAETHGIERAHGDYASLAADPDIDAVYVAGLHPVHAEQSIMFLEAGKHVLVEKPIALNRAQTDAMIAAAEDNDRFLMEAMWMRFNPVHVEVMRRLSAGEIGEVRRVTADFSFAMPHNPQHRLLDPEKGGGALLDLMIYPIHLAWWALGEPDHIAHHGHVGSTAVDDEINLFATWSSGATALLTSSVRLPGSMAARIEGTEGVVELPFPAHASHEATLRSGPDSTTIEAEPASLHHQVVEVHRCLRAGENQSPRMPWELSQTVMGHFDRIRADLGVRYPADG